MVAIFLAAAALAVASLLAQLASPTSTVVPIPDPLAAETSSLAVSATDPRLLWTTGDSGDLPQLLSIDLSGATVGAWWVGGAANVDWEDMARLPGPGPALLVADTGDNARRRETVAFLRVPEPFPANGWGETLQAETFAGAYPDGPRDAEALLVHPLTGEIALVTKRSWLAAEVYRVTLDAGLATLELAGTVDVPGFGPFSQVTGGVVSPDGTRLALLSYGGIAEWDIAPGQSLADALAGKPRSIELQGLGQAEAITYAADGSALFVTSEGDPARLATIPLDPER